MEKILKQEPSDCVKIVLFGPESTGKTTLASELADYFNTEWVPEYMREYLQKKWDELGERISWEDLLPIAQGQISAENETAKNANGILFCDTDLRELKVYCEYYYDGKCPEEIRNAVENNSYTLYLLTDIDSPWVADDLRDRPEDRTTLFRIFEKELIENGLNYHVLNGSRTEKFNKAVALTKKLVGR
ncbi:MAG: ATP-binding protein [Bacteroidia bacterium]|nr:ATP-binding protein [Bacteroidia bacterium]NNF30437.1 ATP-binding protein [Flavobacteriaceae bacterium]MBT8275662.1 ATP-binding protein [Bacteroidia bacterium]NNJ82664.1 ATP-binding protein [Flavobacteriaceae bacterium]NNK54305.1 ATP-binding protein [Flavobacteriaceae bacterium]